jgi:hypothetical protein
MAAERAQAIQFITSPQQSLQATCRCINWFASFGALIPNTVKYIIVLGINADRGMSDLVPICKEALTSAEYQALADVPPAPEWLANITNAKTRRACKVDVAEFIAFTGLPHYMDLHTVTRAHARNLPARRRKRNTRRLRLRQ